MMGNIQAIEVQIPREVVQYWGWFLVFGIGLLALGIAAVVRSGVGHSRHDVVLRMALGVGLRHRDRVKPRDLRSPSGTRTGRTMVSASLKTTICHGLVWASLCASRRLFS